MNAKKRFVAAALAVAFFVSLPAFSAPPNERTRTAFPPFNIVANIYYVGNQELASYIVKTSDGLILLNTGFEENTPMIEKSMEALGFHMKDVKILLISHAHTDHDGGAKDVIAASGAKYAVMDRDVEVVESGGKLDYHYWNNPEEYYPAVKVDRVLHDGDTVQLGGTVMTAHWTPGHTKGNTTWTMDVTVDGKVQHVVFIGSPNGNRGMILLNNPRYPNIVADFERGFDALRKLPCDIPLGSHGNYFDLPTKYKKWQAGDKTAFIDPEGYKAFIDKTQHIFEAEVAKQVAEMQTRSLAGK
jgi:metallo-beta-lactamase class B